MGRVMEAPKTELTDEKPARQYAEIGVSGL
jgi:hypothetical protein